MRSSPPDTLVVNVAGLLGEVPGSFRDVAVEEVALDLGEEVVQSAPAGVWARLARTNRGLLVTGRASTRLADVCARCLVAIEIPVDVAIEEEVLPSIDLESGALLDRSADPEAVRLTDHHELDLAPLAREAIQLAVPIAPVCRPDCAGLCPECGADRNAGPHEHADTAVDPRLAILRELEVDEQRVHE